MKVKEKDQSYSDTAECTVESGLNYVTMESKQKTSSIYLINEEFYCVTNLQCPLNVTNMQYVASSDLYVLHCKLNVLWKSQGLPLALQTAGLKNFCCSDI